MKDAAEREHDNKKSIPRDEFTAWREKKKRERSESTGGRDSLENAIVSAETLLRPYSRT